MGLASPSAVLDHAPALRACLTSVAQAMAAQGVEELPASMEDIIIKFSSSAASKWRSEVVTRIRQNIKSGATEEFVTTMLESGGSGGGSWMATPSAAQHCLTNQEFTTSSRLRMNLDVHRTPPDRNLTCAHKGGQRVGFRTCRQAADAKGLHPLLCKLGGHVVARHDKIRDVVATLIHETLDVPVHTEQRPPGDQPDDRHPDVDYYDSRMVRQYLDVEVVTPHARAQPGASSLRRPGALLEIEEGKKRRKYDTLRLTPAVLTHLGRIGSGLQSFFRGLGIGADERARSDSISRCYQTIACALQRENVKILAAAAPLLP